jgi:hypothetical protein
MLLYILFLAAVTGLGAGFGYWLDGWLGAGVGGLLVLALFMWATQQSRADGG